MCFVQMLDYYGICLFVVIKWERYIVYLTDKFILSCLKQSGKIRPTARSATAPYEKTPILPMRPIDSVRYVSNANLSKSLLSTIREPLSSSQGRLRRYLLKIRNAIVICKHSILFFNRKREWRIRRMTLSMHVSWNWNLRTLIIVFWRMMGLSLRYWILLIGPTLIWMYFLWDAEWNWEAREVVKESEGWDSFDSCADEYDEA